MDRALSYLIVVNRAADPNFPKCVLREIADAHGIDYNPRDIETDDNYCYELIETINTSGIEQISTDTSQWGDDVYTAIGRFVNKYGGDGKGHWKKRTLTEAYNFIWSFNPLEEHDLSHFGLPTNEFPHSISYVLAYLICLTRKVEGLDLHTSPKMLEMATTLSVVTDKRFKDEFIPISISFGVSRTELIATLLKLNSEKSKK